MIQFRISCFVSLSMISLVVLGCKKDISKPLSLDASISKDEFRYIDGDDSKVYEVQHIVHDDEVDKHDTITYLLKQEVYDTFIDNSNTINKVVNYYKFDSFSSSWVFYKKGTFSIMGNSWVKKLDNISRVAIKFPFSTSINWNAFPYNDIPPVQLMYKQLHQKVTLSGVEYDSTLTLGATPLYTLVDFKKQFEIYAKNKGMIYSYYKDLIIRNFDTLNVRLGEEWYYTLKNK